MKKYYSFFIFFSTPNRRKKMNFSQLFFLLTFFSSNFLSVVFFEVQIEPKSHIRFLHLNYIEIILYYSFIIQKLSYNIVECMYCTIIFFSLSVNLLSKHNKLLSQAKFVCLYVDLNSIDWKSRLVLLCIVLKFNKRHILWALYCA